MNDVGKTNFLYALRFVFDKEIRKNGFVDTDYYRKNTNNPIEITVVLDIEDEENDDSQKLRAKIKGGLLTGENKVFIKLVGEYDKKVTITHFVINELDKHLKNPTKEKVVYDFPYHLPYSFS